MPASSSGTLAIFHFPEWVQLSPASVSVSMSCFLSRMQFLWLQVVDSFLLWSLVPKEMNSWGILFPHLLSKSYPSHLLYSPSVPCPNSLQYLFGHLQHYQWISSWLVCKLEEGKRAGACLSCSLMYPWYLGDTSCSYFSRGLDKWMVGWMNEWLVGWVDGWLNEGLDMFCHRQGLMKQSWSTAQATA